MYIGDDSYFLEESLRVYLRKQKKEIRILDMGAGTGIHSKLALSLGFKNLVSCDIDKNVVSNLKKKKLEVIKSDLFSDIKGKFDLIWFNPPYLPNDKFDKEKDTAGGKLGDETIIKFLKQAKKHLAANGKIILLLSSFTPRERINKLVKEKKILAEKKLFFEKLEIWEIRLN